MLPSSRVIARRMVRITRPSMSAARFASTGPPDPLPNRPLRGDRSQRRSDNNTLSDHGFLEQFKFGVHHQDPVPEETPKMEQQPEDSDALFKTLKERGLIPNAVAMLDGLCKDGLVQEAMKLFGAMRDKGTIPEVVIYTAVVEAFCKAHKPQDAKRVFRKMQSNGIAPNAFTYGVFVQGLCHCNMLDDALDFSLEMLDSGHSPNIPTFVGLVDAFCRGRGLERGQLAVQTLTQKGFALDLKAVKDFMDKRAPFPSLAWEAISKKKPLDKLF